MRQESPPLDVLVYPGSSRIDDDLMGEFIMAFHKSSRMAPKKLVLWVNIFGQNEYESIA